MLMSFIGAVGNLMTKTGLADIMSSAFAGVHKMLLSKKFLMCMRALRMVVEVILIPIIDDCEVQCNDAFMAKNSKEQDMQALVRLSRQACFVDDGICES